MTEIIHKRGRGEPQADAFAESGELAIDIETGRVYTLTELGTVVCVGPSGGGNKPRGTHTLYCKATYTTNDAVATDQFQALKFDMYPYHQIGQYTYGFKFGQRFGPDDTTGLTESEGMTIELYDSTGSLVYAVEADELTHNDDDTMTISWDVASKTYAYNLQGRHGDSYYVKIGNLGGTVRAAQVEPREPPPDEN